MSSLPQESPPPLQPITAYAAFAETPLELPGMISDSGGAGNEQVL